MLIEQIIEFELRGSGALCPHMYSYNSLFSWQNKNLKGKFSSGLLFTAKIVQEAMYLTSNLPEQNHLQNLNPKCKILNEFWT